MHRCNCGGPHWDDTVTPLQHGKPTGQHRLVGRIERGLMNSSYAAQCAVIAALIVAIALVAAN